jgi:hypothetical protein
MSQYMPLMVLANSDTAFNLSVTLNGAILPLTGYTPKVYQKATKDALDSSGILYQVGTGLTIVNSALGQLKLVIPHTNVTASGTQWWKLTLTDTNGGIFPVFYGPLTIKAA